MIRMICKNCRWWERLKADSEPCCYNVDSDMRFDRTDAEYGCNHWEQRPEQDGNATWYMD